MSDGFDPDSLLWIRALLQTAVLAVVIAAAVNLFILVISGS